MPRFWPWLVKEGGWRRIISKWLFLHLSVGCILAMSSPMHVSAAGATVLLPLAGVLVGMCFAWAGNAHAILQTSEMEDIARERRGIGGVAEYVFTYQLAIFVLLLTTCLWGVASLQVFDRGAADLPVSSVEIGAGVLLYSLTSLAVRECWHVVLGAQLMLLMRHRVREQRGASVLRNTKNLPHDAAGIGGVDETVDSLPIKHSDNNSIDDENT